MLRRAWLFLPFIAWGATGCAAAAAGPVVTYVPTNTPGLMYVIVHPQFKGLATGLTLSTGDHVNPVSDYILLCDGRPENGMHCAIPSEAAVDRVSYTPKMGVAAKAIDEGVGTLSSGDGVLTHEEPPAPEIRPTAFPPPPALPLVGKGTTKAGAAVAPPSPPPSSAPAAPSPPRGAK